jgi:ATP-dependent protease Clp ATPase subunit
MHLSRSESSLIHQYERSFAAYGITLRFQPEALRRLAVLARDEKTGARGLMTVLERTFRDLKIPASLDQDQVAHDHARYGGKSRGGIEKLLAEALVTIRSEFLLSGVRVRLA